MWLWSSRAPCGSIPSLMHPRAVHLKLISHEQRTITLSVVKRTTSSVFSLEHAQGKSTKKNQRFQTTFHRIRVITRWIFPEEKIASKQANELSWWKPGWTREPNSSMETSIICGCTSRKRYGRQRRNGPVRVARLIIGYRANARLATDNDTNRATKSVRVH